MMGGQARVWLVLAIGCTLAGCGDGELQQELEVAKESVQAALDAWKRGESVAALKARATPIEFHDDDWKRAARLIDYEIGPVYRETDGAPRCAATLTVQHRGRKALPAKVTYQVNLKPKIVIARDPFS